MKLVWRMTGNRPALRRHRSLRRRSPGALATCLLKLLRGQHLGVERHRAGRRTGEPGGQQDRGMLLQEHHASCFGEDPGAECVEIETAGEPCGIKAHLVSSCRLFRIDDGCDRLANKV